MSDDKFFEDNQETTVDTIKLGDKEYSQEDLSRLVGLGEQAVELETKWNTKLDRVMPEYTKATQKVSEYEKRVQELENKPAPQPTFDQLTSEQKDMARKQLEELGYGQDQFRQIVREELAAKELLGDVDNIISSAQENGNPSTTPQDLLRHMAETGIKNPTKAYKDMFETELDAIKEKKLAEIRPSGMITTQGGQAGAKIPAPTQLPRNRADLAKLVQEALSGGQG